MHRGVMFATYGTTSACAENTSPPPGEGRLQQELPPRARRILGPYTGAGKINGTTSACAENTVGLSPKNCLSWNYLRVRGEYPK